jgi:hypothetical protein
MAGLGLDIGSLTKSTGLSVPNLGSVNSLKDSMPNQVSLNSIPKPSLLGGSSLTNTNSSLPITPPTIGGATNLSGGTAAFFKADTPTTAPESVAKSIGTVPEEVGPPTLTQSTTIVAPTTDNPTTGAPKGADTASGKESEVDVNYENYVYKLEIGIYYDAEDELQDLSTNVLACNLINNYDVNVMPFFELEMMLSKNVYNDLLKFYTEATAVLRLTMFRSNRGNEPDILPENIIEPMSCSIIDLQGQPMPGGIDTLTDDQPNIPVVMYLFLEEHLRVTKSIINRIFTNCTMESVVSQINTENSTIPVLMVKPNIEKKYEQVVIPPMTIRRVMDYLQMKYGIYKDGLRFFFGFHYLYIMSRSQSASPQDDYKEVIIESVSGINNNLLEADGSYTDDEAEVHKIRTSFVPIFKLEHNLCHLTDGEKMLVGGSSQTAHSTAQCDAVQGMEKPLDAKKSKERAVWDKSSNEFATHEYAKKSQEDSDKVTIQMALINMFLLTPDKVYRIKFADRKLKKHDGTYRISNSGYRLSRRAGDVYMVGNSLSEFLLIERDEVLKNEDKPFLVNIPSVTTSKPSIL